MDDSAYRIFPSWKDVMVYEEGQGRELRLNCDGAEPWYYVTVPTAQRWVEKMPAWAHERREIILQRLRGAKCVICEEGTNATSIFSPDGTCRVEIAYEPDDRGPPIRSIRVVAREGNRVLADIYNAVPAGRVEFPREGVLTVPFRLYEAKYQIGINVAAETFWFHPMEERPLAELGAAIQALLPEVVLNSEARPSYMQRSPLGILGMFAMCLLFVGAGIWQAVDGKTVRDHWMGAVCALFFGACAVVPVVEFRKWRNWQRQMLVKQRNR